jgi:hypothetical protein
MLFLHCLNPNEDNNMKEDFYEIIVMKATDSCAVILNAVKNLLKRL